MEGADQELFTRIKRLLAERPSGATLQGGLQAAWGHLHVRTSTGLAVSYQQTQYREQFSFDSLVRAVLKDASIYVIDGNGDVYRTKGVILNFRTPKMKEKPEGNR